MYTTEELMSLCKIDNAKGRQLCFTIKEAQKMLIQYQKDFDELVDEISNDKYTNDGLNWKDKIKFYFKCLSFAFLGLAVAPCYRFNLLVKALKIYEKQKEYLIQLKNRPDHN